MIAPSFIYGGNSFELSPPRVPAGYGGFIENTLGSGAWSFCEKIVRSYFSAIIRCCVLDTGCVQVLCSVQILLSLDCMLRTDAYFMAHEKNAVKQVLLSTCEPWM